MVDQSVALANQRGIYNNDYFSGAQVALYIGDILVDEVTSLAYGVAQERTPIYGYASRKFDAVSEGQIIVSGQFSINFKEAGYLWLVLQRYKHLIKGKSNPFVAGTKGAKERTADLNIEQAINGELRTNADGQPRSGLTIKDYQELAALNTAELQGKLKQAGDEKVGKMLSHLHSSLTGYSSSTRAFNPAGQAENIFETFENYVWGGNTGQASFTDVDGIRVTNAVSMNRRCDDPDLNPFDIYIAFGDYTGDDNIHHTVQRLEEVYIIGASKQIVIDGTPIQEVYNFIARDII